MIVVGVRTVAGAVSVTGAGRTGAGTDVAGNPRKVVGAKKLPKTGAEIGAGMTPGMSTNAILIRWDFFTTKAGVIYVQSKRHLTVSLILR